MRRSSCWNFLRFPARGLPCRQLANCCMSFGFWDLSHCCCCWQCDSCSSGSGIRSCLKNGGLANVFHHFGTKGFCFCAFWHEKLLQEWQISEGFKTGACGFCGFRDAYVTFISLRDVLERMHNETHCHYILVEKEITNSIRKSTKIGSKIPTVFDYVTEPRWKNWTLFSC